MASTIAIYTGDGTTTDFTVPFDYLAKKFVKVSVGLTVLEGGDYGDTSKDYYFLDKTTVRLKTAPQAGAEVTVRRYTSATDRIVSFKDASILKATDLDTASIQTIHIAEEGRDVINDALIVDKEGNWDAKGHRIVNVGDPVNDGDAVNFKTYKADAMGAYQSRIEAEEARDRAKESEVNAKESEKVITGIADIIVPIAPEIEIVADNIDHVVTDSNNIDKINIVGTDLAGSLHPRKSICSPLRITADSVMKPLHTSSLCLMKPLTTVLSLLSFRQNLSVAVKSRNFVNRLYLVRSMSLL